MIKEIELEFTQPISSSSANINPIVIPNYWIALLNNKLVRTVGILTIKNKSAILKNK